MFTLIPDLDFQSTMKTVSADLQSKNDSHIDISSFFPIRKSYLLYNIAQSPRNTKNSFNHKVEYQPIHYRFTYPQIFWKHSKFQTNVTY